MSQVFVNGNETPHHDDESVRDLLARVGLDLELTGLAVAVNDEVLPRGEWSLRRVAAGDHIEVLHAVQGG